jgi:hypothetical protein
MHQIALSCTPILEFRKSAGFEPKQSNTLVFKLLDSIFDWVAQLAQRSASYRYHAVKLHFTLRNCLDSQLTQCQRLVGKYDQMSFR